jgi:hypothetical protein
MVKEILQESGITLMLFANDLSISRPTLDGYILAFDGGQKIGNNFYQDIFEFLFENENISDVEFDKRYKYMRDYYGLTGAKTQPTVSKLKSGYSLPKGDYELILDDVIRRIESDRIGQETPKENYKLILFSLNNMTPKFLDMVNFYTYFAGIRDINGLNDDQKRRYAVLYKTLEQMDSLTQRIPDGEVADFVKYAARKDEAERAKIEVIKTTLTENITQLITDKLAQDGADSVDVDGLVETIKTQLKGKKD